MKTFSARETVWLQELDGIELAGFWRRAIAFLIDTAIVGIVFSSVLSTVATIQANRHPGTTVAVSIQDAATKLDEQEAMTRPPREVIRHELRRESLKVLTDIVVPILYFGLLLWQGNGRTPGKRLMKVRVVSLVHTHMTFWHSVERALGYGAAALEGGFGFAQYFLHTYRRCAQDRLAETIVVTERSYRQRFPKALGTPPEVEALPVETPDAADPAPGASA